MPRIVEDSPNLELNIVCPFCDLIVAYHKYEVLSYKYDYSIEQFIFCPNEDCHHKIELGIK